MVMIYKPCVFMHVGIAVVAASLGQMCKVKRLKE